MYVQTFRYFSSCSPAVKSTVPAQHLEHKGEGPTRSNSTTSSLDSNDPCVPLVNSSIPPPAQSSATPKTASQDIGLFHWSPNSTLTEPSLRTGSTLGQVGLQQFKYKKSFSPPTKTVMSPGKIFPSVSPITEVSTHLNGDLPDSLVEPSIPRQKFPTSTLPTSQHQDAASVCLLALQCLYDKCVVVFFVFTHTSFFFFPFRVFCLVGRYWFVLFLCILRKWFQTDIWCQSIIPHMLLRQKRNPECPSQRQESFNTNLDW